jgi:hypothetical protein
MVGAQGAVRGASIDSSLFERFERDLLGPPELDTERVPLGIRFHPSGLSASLTATHWDEDGTFTFFFDPTVPLRSGSDDFWTVDAVVSYRLRKRDGIGGSDESIRRGVQFL